MILFLLFAIWILLKYFLKIILKVLDARNEAGQLTCPDADTHYKVTAIKNIKVQE